MSFPCCCGCVVHVVVYFSLFVVSFLRLVFAIVIVNVGPQNLIFKVWPKSGNQ